jgi:CDP-diacylglycerol--glycerol-3-phosphate 3-phosphatidyltransferase
MKVFYKYIPNVLSSFRIIAAPFLLVIAWQGRPNLFLGVLALSLFSDAVDGFVARSLAVTSERGAKLDSWGDFITYLTVPLCAWFLWPEILKHEALFIMIGITFFILPALVSFIKFKRLSCYHTLAAKILAVLMFSAIFILFTTGIAWPFRCAVVLLCFVAIEEIAITLWLTEQRCNIPSFWHLLHSPYKGQAL